MDKKMKTTLTWYKYIKKNLLIEVSRILQHLAVILILTVIKMCSFATYYWSSNTHQHI